MSKHYVQLKFKECFGSSKEDKECRKCALYRECVAEYAKKLVAGQ